MDRYFEWDEAKAQSNYRKHGISFDVASRVFDDPLCRTEQDRIESGEYPLADCGYGKRLFVADGGAHGIFLWWRKQ